MNGWGLAFLLYHYRFRKEEVNFKFDRSLLHFLNGVVVVTWSAIGITYCLNTLSQNYVGYI